MGDIFEVPIDESRRGFGQVIAAYQQDAYYLAIFDRAYARDRMLPDLGHVAADRIALLALSFDAKVKAGHWRVVGAQSVPDEVPLPAYTVAVGEPDDVWVEDYSGQRRRRASPGEAEFYLHRSFVAPVRLEKALRALHELEPWQDHFDDLRPDEGRTTRRAFGEGTG
ncbi:MAG TPA: Imm26 family immunity protein [Mycobacteriales bacterium]|nr:Imm26 family immunity protein [Mycobacteriales bacterium]